MTPEQSLFEGEIQRISGTSREGSFGILPGHIPAMMSLEFAPLRLTEENGEERVFSVYGGFLYKQREDKIKVMVPEAKPSEEVDGEEAQTKLDQLEGELEELPAESEAEGEQLREIKRLQRERERVRTDLKVVEDERQ